MIQILKRVQDLRHSHYLCSLLSLTLTSMHLRIPLQEMRNMYDRGDLAAYHKELVAKKDVHNRWQKVSMLTRLASQRSMHKARGADTATTAPDPLVAAKAKAEAGQEADGVSIERILGTAVVMAYLEVTRTVKRKQLAAQVQRQRLMDATETGLYEKYLSACRVMMSTIHKQTGWYYRTIMWNLFFLQKPDGSFDISPSLATTLYAGDSSSLLVNPTNVLDEHDMRVSTPSSLIDQCATVDEAYTLWATLCVIGRLKRLPFVWVINPTAIPEERCTIASLATEYVATQLVQHKPEEITELASKAESTVDGWTAQRIMAVKGLRWQVEMTKSAMIVHKENTAYFTPELSSKEKWDLRLQQLKTLALAALRNHPWAKIAVVKKDEVYTRAQRILNQCNGILLMLLCCLWFYYSKAVTCCEEFRARIGCVADTSVECLGHSACYTLMASEPYNCEGFQCDALEDSDVPDGYQPLPGGFTCSAFPKDTLMDKVWMAIFITAIILPVNLSFMTLFTAGGTYQVPNHWESNVKIKADKVCPVTSLPDVCHMSSPYAV
ncbi:hypothetical protein CYMTET_35137 [Cymbomonas tetramitiformis]|uniref:Uncharacterized protein n=1 Tax=Cymbomonas tetramitiformis TaxID=36881 RepID=A0AAE0KPA0_9CHLO|nr:hypothetical protein CYMTET_35137 [Cymbomonas tetramitiformis]